MARGKVISTTLQLKDEFSPELLKTAKKLQKMNGDLNESTKEIKKLSNSFKSIQNPLKALGEDAKKVGGLFVDFGTKTTKAIGGVVTSLAKLSFNKALDFGKWTLQIGADFEQAMAKVKAVSGATGAEFDKLKDKARELGGLTKFSATQVAESMGYLAMAGWDSSQIESSISGVLNLASASGSELDKTADIVSNVISALKMDASEAGHVADVLSKIQASSNTTLESLGETFAKIATLGGVAGYSIEEIGLLAGLLGNVGAQGSIAGRSLKTIVGRLAAPTEEVAGAMEELGIKFADANGNIKPLGELVQDLRKSFKGLNPEQRIFYAQMIAGADHVDRFVEIVSVAEEDFNKLTWAINEASGTADSMSATMNNTLAGSFLNLRSAVEEVGLTFFDELGGTAKGAVDSLVEKLREWNSDGTIADLAKKAGELAGAFKDKLKSGLTWLIENKETVVETFKNIVTALSVGTVITFAGAIAGAVKNLITLGTTLAGLLSPVGWAVTAIVGLGAIVIANFDKIKNGAITLWEKLKEIGSAISTAWGGFWASLKDMGERFFGWFDDKIEGLPVIGNIYSGGKKIIGGAVGAFKDFFNIGENASGTNYWQGGLTWIHERGGEIVNLPRGTQIIPHDVSMRMAEKAGGAIGAIKNMQNSMPKTVSLSVNPVQAELFKGIEEIRRPKSPEEYIKRAFENQKNSPQTINKQAFNNFFNNSSPQNNQKTNNLTTNNTFNMNYNIPAYSDRNYIKMIAEQVAGEFLRAFNDIT